MVYLTYKPIINQAIDVSILVRFYNQKQYVNKCLESIINQITSIKYEIIIGDDGSADGTVQVIDKWINKYPGIIQLFVMERNPDDNYNHFERASNNYLTLITKARGRYICYLDGDDYYTSQYKIERQVRLLDNNQMCDICFSNYYILKPNGSTEHNNLPFCTEVVHIKDYWKRKMYVPLATLMFRNVDIRFFPNNFDDISVVFSYFYQKKACFLNETTFCYNQTSVGAWGKTDSIYKLVVVLKDFVACITINKWLKKASYIRYMDYLIDAYRKRNKLRLFVDNISDFKHSKYLTIILNKSTTCFFQKLYTYIVYRSFIIYDKINSFNNRLINKLKKIYN